MLCLLFVGTKGYTQSVITGKIFDENNRELSGATIIISTDSTSAILAYGISNEKGNFDIKLNSTSDSLFIKVSFIGYKTWAKTIENKTSQLSVQLTPSSEELKEVLIEAKIIEQRGDTLSFSVSAFKDQKDRVIADIIKKLPGIEMRPGGQIYYNGKPIQKYYIEGLDLLEGRYSLANENLAVDDVSKVEILENHQPIKVLDSLEFSERASLNIKLKKEITTSGTAEVGLGLAPLLWKAKITPMIFTKKRQAIVTYQSNNTGSDVSREIRDFSFDLSGNDFSIDKTNWLSIQKLSEPPFAQERWLDNNVHLGSVNFLQRIKEDVDLKVNLSYLNDAQTQQGSTQTRFFTPTDTINLIEKTNNDIFINTLQSKFTLEKNTEKNYLKNQLELNAFWDSQRGLIQQSDVTIHQNLNNPFTAIRNKLRVLKTLGKQLITFRSNIGYTHANQNLLVSPGQFEGILNKSEPYSEIEQILKTSHFFTNNSAGITKGLGKFTISPEIGFSIEKQQIDSDLFLNENNQISETDFKNRLDFVTSNLYFKNAFRFKSNDETWNLRLSTPLSLKSFKLDDENILVKRKIERLVFEPNFYVKKKLSAFLESSISAGLNYDFGEVQQLYYGFILTNYRNLQRYNAPIAQQVNQKYNGTLSYRNPLKRLFFSGSYSYTLANNNLLYSNQISENGANVLQAIEKDNFSNSNNFNLNGSKYFSKINTTLKLSANYSVTKREQLLNGNFVDVGNKNFRLSGSLDAEISSWLTVTYNGIFSVYETAFENAQPALPTGRIQQIKTNKHTVDAFFYLADNQYFSGGGEYYGNSLSEENANNYFVNFSYQYTFEKPKIDLNIGWNNILNTDEFVNAYTNEFSYVESRYQLRPSQVVASLKFSF
ncbi:carboxypeptidase-like regulatory domain-containing protein [Gillisia hiemivivida]|uniref:carboxypeptidase-like regulatory domain-containing protein n=1 Tax=Gillisia hiemivivida TaxID=291190 RepID=UPI001FE7487C|nr:carboxypeptidase-like regulatory domain-containing protein [Gillisia hiemivivida]